MGSIDDRGINACRRDGSIHSPEEKKES